ncbi:MAG: hypothetical protein LC647_12920 [Beggiatoa sp.]|nr:hypothetical protein [Beggiatoa sp.]
MELRWNDFNGADAAADGNYRRHWAELEEVLRSMPVHLKASDQAGIQGSVIFDPVGTNDFIKTSLVARGWQANIPIPSEFSFLGTDVDFGKEGVVGEAQFSNYPFLLNNVMRAELLYKGSVHLTGSPTGLVVIVTKAHMFPASNSTLYYEQAVGQLSALSEKNVFESPIRAVGLFEREEGVVDVKWTTYGSPRYSRTIVTREDRRCEVSPGKSSRSRSVFRLL